MILWSLDDQHGGETSMISHATGVVYNLLSEPHAY